MALAFLDFSNGALGDHLRAHRALYNIRINNVFNFWGAKGGYAWQ